jgi:hypothetical protein
VLPATSSPGPSGVPVPARQDGANEPEDREDKADQAEDPVPLAEREKGKREHQNQIDDGHGDNPAGTGHDLTSVRDYSFSGGLPAGLECIPAVG